METGRNILQEIALRTKERIAEKKRSISLEALKDMVKPTGNEFPFEQALRKPELSFICEIKKASPSKGLIAADFPYLQIAQEYEAAGAHAISVLTEPFYFKGEDRFIEEISKTVTIPLLRKDFTVDSYMIYEAKLLGASAILLICAILGEDELKEYLALAHELGLSALVETHDEQEAERAIQAGARIIGVNNRDLKTFQVDLSITERLRPLIPKDKIFVSESGIQTRDHIKRLEEMGTDAVLIGETFMRSSDKTLELKKLSGKM